jgi:hypothetical protein
MQVRAADAAEGDLDFDLAIAADRFVDVEDIEVAFSRRKFDEGLHGQDGVRDIIAGFGRANSERR